MKIGIDLMGGDFAPNEPLLGVQLALQEPDLLDTHLVLLGDESEASNKEFIRSSPSRVTIVPTTEVIGMSEHPTRAVAQKKSSSISVGLAMLADGSLDAFISAGNTGAIMVSSLYTVKAIDGIIRPSLYTLVPKANGGTGLMLDVGANADVKADVMVQFAILGSQYARHVLNIPNPKIGLLSIGHEKEKGNLLTQAVYALLANETQLNFIGNIEGFDLFDDRCDVIVCDGFTGNVILKTCEGFYRQLKQRGVQDEFLDRFDFEHYGGTAILGVNKPVIIGHGISTASTFVNMVRLAKRVIESGYITKIKSALIN
ncbi:MAG: phosphate acyltransferase PlsX [Flavobacteriales bacterium]|nr:phosphate acyltransferase PlsX [Flavobacteriales bacterium]